MFGEKYIIGHKTMHLDNKGRIIMPPFTSVSANDELGIMIKSEDELRVFLFENYKNLLERYKNIRDMATTIEEYNKYTMILEQLFSDVECLVMADNQNRIKIPMHTLEKIKWIYPSQCECIGLGTKLSIRQKTV